MKRKYKIAIGFIVVAILIGTVIGSISVGLSGFRREREKWDIREWPASKLLEDSYSYEQDGWLFVHLEGEPYQIGYQNGYLTATSANEWLSVYTSWYDEDDYEIAKNYLWPAIPPEYQDEFEGVAAGLQARGYTWDKWDVLVANAWPDIGTYYGLSTSTEQKGLVQAAEARPEQDIKKGCSAFIATGDATTRGQIVTGHNTWCPYDEDYAYYVMYDVDPKRGYSFRYQSAGASIWSGQDWYINSAGLTITETSLGRIEERHPEGLPVFVRIRKAVQYANRIDKFIHIMTTDNSGAYPNEWLVGDTKTGEILSLQLGTDKWDIHRTFNGFYGSSNFAWGENFREEADEEGRPAPPYDTSTGRYARFVRWQQLAEEYYGKVDVEIGKRMLSDHYDVYLEEETPSSRTICGHGENDVDEPYPSGAYDGKVTSSPLVKDGMSMWARWGHPCGTPFNATEFLEMYPEFFWAADGLYKFDERTPQLWTLLGDQKPKRYD